LTAGIVIRNGGVKGWSYP